MGGGGDLPARFLRRWRALPGPGAVWLETLAPLQYAAYPLRDVEGRPLGELNAPADLVPPVDLVTCPYGDSRRGALMNSTALRPVVANWGWILESVRAVRGAFPAGPLDVAELWSLSAVLLCIPLFMVRTGGASDGAIPVEIAALYKVVQGVYMAAWASWREQGEAAIGVPVSPGVLVGWILAHDGLRNRSAPRVCPGPIGLIRELVATCVAPVVATEPVGPVLDYGTTYAALSLEKWLFERGPDPAAGGIARYRDRLAGWSAPDGAAARFTALQRRLCAIVASPAPETPFDPSWLRGQLPPLPPDPPP